jgi:transcriptional regulator with XRE-family HTH domain
MSDAVHKWPLGERVREARGTEPLKVVARRAGIGAETLWQIENGRRRDDYPFSAPKAEIIAKAARALQIPVSEALTLAGYKPEDHLAVVDEGMETQLASKVAQLAPEQIRAIEIIVDSLLRERGYIDPETPQRHADSVVRSIGEAAQAGVYSHGEPAGGGEQRVRRAAYNPPRED